VLPSAERLRRASVFKRAYSKRIAVSSPILTLYVLPKEGKKSSRKGGWLPLAGFVVSTKVSKSACKRNRARRRIREAYRALRTEYQAGSQDGLRLDNLYAVVFVGHEPALTATFKEIEKAVFDALTRAARKFGG